MIEELYRKYHQELLGWCESMTGNLQTAEELVQEAFLRAMLHESILHNLLDYQCRSWLCYRYLGTVRSKLSSARKHIKEALGGKNYVR